MNKNIANKSQTTMEQSTEEKSLLHRNNRINYTKEFICVNKNQVWFSLLSPEIKHVFVYSLKQCSSKDCIKQVFYRWKDQENTTIEPKRFLLKDQDALQLIWKIQKAIARKKIAQSTIELNNQLLTIQKQYKSYKLLYKNTNAKLKELNSQKFQKSIQNDQQNLSAKMTTFITQIQQKMIPLKNKMKKTKNQLNQRQAQQQLTFEPSIMNPILSKAIAKEIRNLLSETIIAIIQITHQIVPENEVDNQEVYVVFEQAYLTKKIKKTTIVRLIGSENYLEKISNFNQFMSHRAGLTQVQKNQNNLACCHRCLKICSNKHLKFCHTIITQVQTSSYSSSDYYSYRKTYLQGDYFYEPIQQHILPFFLYNLNSKNKLICNRGFCQSCFSSFNQKQKLHNCPYCRGLCSCARCDRAFSIIKLIAFDHINDPQQQKKYHSTLTLFGGHTHPDVSQTLDLRVPTNRQELPFLEKVWTNWQQAHSQLKLNLTITIEGSNKIGQPLKNKQSDPIEDQSSQLQQLTNKRNLVTDQYFQMEEWINLRNSSQYL